MKKVFRMKNLECAGCAAKMETAIQKLEGVLSVSISFFTQRMTLEYREGSLETLLPLVEKAIRNVEPGCTLQK